MVQLYKLLELYPPEQLVVAQANIHSSTAKRLKDVRYFEVRIGHLRPLRTRFACWYSALLIWRALRPRRQIRRLCHWFKPDAIFTVAHGFMWLTAAALARETRLPLHLFVHDDPLLTVSLPRFLTQWFNEKFAEVYREAASRLCVSPFMVEVFKTRYGAAGEVLYASRAHDAKEYDAPISKHIQEPFVFGFAGSVNSPDYVEALKALARGCTHIGGRVKVYGPFSRIQAKAVGLDEPNIDFVGMVPRSEIVATLRADVHVLFVPMSFALEDKPNMEISFASKLSDYTATGLPLLIYGPPYCSAVRWAKLNPGVAEVVTAQNHSCLKTAVDKLASDADYRTFLSKRALAVGRELFSHEVAWRQFVNAIQPITSTQQHTRFSISRVKSSTKHGA